MKDYIKIGLLCLILVIVADIWRMEKSEHSKKPDTVERVHFFRPKKAIWRGPLEEDRTFRELSGPFKLIYNEIIELHETVDDMDDRILER